eukprot:752575-Hanusia_phi.AAC.1
MLPAILILPPAAALCSALIDLRCCSSDITGDAAAEAADAHDDLKPFPASRLSHTPSDSNGRSLPGNFGKWKYCNKTAKCFNFSKRVFQIQNEMDEESQKTSIAIQFLTSQHVCMSQQLYFSNDEKNNQVRRRSKFYNARLVFGWIVAAADSLGYWMQNGAQQWSLAGVDECTDMQMKSDIEFFYKYVAKCRETSLVAWESRVSRWLMTLVLYSRLQLDKVLDHVRGSRGAGTSVKVIFQANGITCQTKQAALFLTGSIKPPFHLVPDDSFQAPTSN